MTDERDRRDRRGPDDLAARGLRRRAQLGLPLLLAARRRPDDRRADPGRLHRRGAASGATGCCGRSPATPQDLQIMYAVDGSRRLAERTLDHLPGYAGSRPVRIGNGAVTPAPDRRGRRGDDRARAARQLGPGHSDDAWALQRVLVDHLAETWQEKDHGLWEIRGPLRHFTHSRVDGLGGVRPRRPRRRGVTASRVPSTVARAARPGARGGARPRASTTSATRSSSTTRRPRSTPPCWCCPRSGSSTATTHGCSAPSRRSSRT